MGNSGWEPPDIVAFPTTIQETVLASIFKGLMGRRADGVKNTADMDFQLKQQLSEESQLSELRLWTLSPLIF